MKLCDHQWSDYGTLKSGDNPTLLIECCVRCGVQRKKQPLILDACCGGRMMWFDRTNPLAVFVDKRKEVMSLCDGRTLEVHPDVIADFTQLPFPDATFYLVVFDPPHMDSLGENSWLAKKYGRLIGDWEIELSEGFRECWRVLKPNGTLIFKWNTTDVPISRVLALTPHAPLFGHTTSQKTHWMCFLKTDASNPSTVDAATAKP